MGRGKSAALSLIQDRRKRFQTFEKRKKGLEKKAHELSTLCDVNICMIMFGPDDVAEGSNDPIIWPNDPNVATRMIDIYETKLKTDRHCSRNANIASIFQDRIRVVEKEVEKLKKQNIEDKYPVWHELYDTFSNDQLLQFGDELDNVLQVLKSRSDSMEAKQEIQANSSYGNRGKELDTYHPFQGLNSFNSLGNEFAKSRSTSMDTHQAFQAIPSYGRGKEIENYHTLQGLNSFNYFGNEGTLAINGSHTMKTPGESSSYYNNQNNNDYFVPANFDHMTTNTNYYYPSTTPELNENLMQFNNNVIKDQQQGQYMWYAPPQGLMQVFMPCPLSSVDASQKVHGGVADQFFGNCNFPF